MPIESKIIKELLESGVHFGHQTNKWNPKMKKFIFGEKSGIYIIDLQKTETALLAAMDFLINLVSKGKSVLFVGTKKQAKQVVREEAQKCGMFFVDERWLGGCLTNFATIRKSVDRLDQLQEMKKGEIYAALAKKEKAHIDREEYKLLKNLEGIRNMHRLPDCLIVVDAEAENIAIREAYKMRLPIVALMDTNCDPDIINYPIPANDDAIRSIRYIISSLGGAIKKGLDKTAVENIKAEKAVSLPEEPQKAPKCGEESAAKVEKIEEQEESEDTEITEGDIKLDK